MSQDYEEYIEEENTVDYVSSQSDLNDKPYNIIELVLLILFFLEVIIKFAIVSNQNRVSNSVSNLYFYQ